MYTMRNETVKGDCNQQNRTTARTIGGKITKLFEIKSKLRFIIKTPLVDRWLSDEKQQLVAAVGVASLVDVAVATVSVVEFVAIAVGLTFVEVARTASASAEFELVVGVGTADSVHASRMQEKLWQTNCLENLVKGSSNTHRCWRTIVLLH